LTETDLPQGCSRTAENRVVSKKDKTAVSSSATIDMTSRSSPDFQSNAADSSVASCSGSSSILVVLLSVAFKIVFSS
jgi:hypothetical protein